MKCFYCRKSYNPIPFFFTKPGTIIKCNNCDKNYRFKINMTRLCFSYIFLFLLFTVMESLAEFYISSILKFISVGFLSFIISFDSENIEKEGITPNSSEK